MKDGAKALEIAERVLQLESQVDALKVMIESGQNAMTRPQIDRKLFEDASRIQNGHEYQQRVAELQRVFESQDDPAILIRDLHNHVLYVQQIPE